jgi:uncharacterized protein YPO0396
VTETRDPETLKAQIEATREELGDTVEALAAKTDVKAQAKRKLDHTRASVTGRKQELLGKAREASPDQAVQAASQFSHRAREHPVPLAVAGAFTTGFLAGRLTRR